MSTSASSIALASLPTALNLVGALAAGLVIGLERGWRDRELTDGGRVAGLRTFALAGLFGGLLASLSAEFGAWPLLAGIIGVSILLAVSYRQASASSGDLSITTALAMLLTIALGAMAARGAVALALACAVVVAVLLNLKPTLHRWLRLIKHRELTAGLQLMVLSVVILPNLPDAGFGPYQALNPYKLWWAVVLIAGLSLAGHFAMRVTGPRRGMLWTGVLGGLASSTATTLALSRYARLNPALAGVAVSGALAACGVMFFRMAVLVALVQPALLAAMGVPLVLTGGTLLVLGVWHWRQLSKATGDQPTEPMMSTFDLGTALGFGAYLAAMAVLAPAAMQWLGRGGVYALASLSGLADVDAIVISLARLHGDGGLPLVTTIAAICLATLANMVSKGAMAWITGGQAMGAPVIKGYAVGMAVGVSAAAAMLLLVGA